MKPNADDVDVPQLTPRAPCRACGRPYSWPKGSKAPGGIGPCCQPTLDEGASEGGAPVVSLPANVRSDEGVPAGVPPSEDEVAPARDLGHLGLDDVLCVGCRDRAADGRLDGVPLCAGCADETVEHWLAWLDDPSHDWWPSDDPFASARYPISGWRDSVPA